ncbi:MAG TPA: acyltransferase [Methanocorpusculum sp.]|nr:acyltransferase [Methanocorpusculum sp.]
MADEKKQWIVRAQPDLDNVLIEAEEFFSEEGENRCSSLPTYPLDSDELSLETQSLDEKFSSIATPTITELFKKCIFPDKVELQECLLKTKNDILVGESCTIEYGLYGHDIVICELCKLTGDVIAEGDLRIDNFCEINGTVICNGDAYLGEGVKVNGKLTVDGNLDIGDNVIIGKEFRAQGDISIRNPVPVLLYLFLYVLTMLHLDNDEDIEKTVNAIILEATSEPLVLPPHTVMNLNSFSVPTPMEIGANCRLHGNITVKSLSLKNDVVIFGGIHSSSFVKIGERTVVHGDVIGSSIQIECDADILGDVVGDKVWLHEDALVNGIIRSFDGLTIGRFRDMQK